MKSFVAITCASLLATLPSLTYAQTTQYYPENTPQACSDRVDNDGDGYVDCYDPDCRYFNFCTPQGQTAPPSETPPPPPPPQAAPPPQPYYQPQSTTYTPPVTSSSSQGNGIGEIIAGSIMLPLGLGLGIGSYPLWVEGFDNRTTGGEIYWIIGGATMAVFGTVLTIIGAIMIPTGVSKHAAWKRRQHRAALPLFDNGKVSLTPEAGASPYGGNMGLKLTF